MNNHPAGLENPIHPDPIHPDPIHPDPIHPDPIRPDPIGRDTVPLQSAAPETATRPEPGQRSPPTPRTLCLWFPNWPIQRLVVGQPELRRQRILLFRRDPRRGQIVSAASPLALRDGVRVGMPISESKSLLRQGGGHFQTFEHDLDADLESLETLVDSLESFSPVIGLETIAPTEFKRGRRPESLLLDVTGLAHLFGDETQLARQLLLHCDGLGYLPRIAIADTVGTAWGLARFFAGQYFTQHQQPLVLPVGDRKAIQQLPVAALRLEPETVATLNQLGIESIGQLQRLSRNDLARRFGDTIHRRLDQMTGQLNEPVTARRKPTEFVASQLLEYPTNHRETIEVILARLIGGICEQLRARQRGALEWTIELVCQTGSPIEFQVNLFQPTATTEQIMPLLEMQLEQALSPHTKKYRKKHPPAKPPTPTPTAPLDKAQSPFHRYTTIQVNEILVRVSSDVLLAEQQRQLFDENPRLDRQSLAHLINRLANRLGTQNVVYPSLQSGAQPEYSFRLKPLVDSRRKRRRKTTRPPLQSHTLARPLRLFQPPLRLQATPGIALSTADADQNSTRGAASRDAPPALLSLPSLSLPSLSLPSSTERHTAPQKITAVCGPERIETGWWRGLTVCRDYWRIETGSQQQFWIFRDLRSGDWFLHGEF